MLTDSPLLFLKRYDQENKKIVDILIVNNCITTKFMVLVHFKWSSTEDLWKDDRDQKKFRVGDDFLFSDSTARKNTTVEEFHCCSGFCIDLLAKGQSLFNDDLNTSN
jgi:hypothetical protein